MSNNIYQPLVEVGPGEEKATVGNALPREFLPEAKNYADDEETKRFIQQTLIPIMDDTRRDRAQMHEEWNNTRNMNLMKHDGGRRYYGRSDSYLPIYRKNRKTLIGLLSRGLFPSDEYMDVAHRGGDLERARAAKHYAQWELDSVARFRSVIKPALANLVDYGTSPLKIWYKKDLVKTVSTKTIRGIISGQDETAYSMQKKCIRDGLAISPRNLFNWYVYPNTAESLDDAQIVFEDMDVPYHFVQEMKEKKKWLHVDEVLSGHEVAEKQHSDSTMLMARGHQSRFHITGAGKEVAFYPVTEIWTYMVLPESAYLSWEDSWEALPVRIMVVGNTPVEVTRNPFYHQKPPYAVGRTDWEPGSFYGLGEGHTTRPLQMLINDFANQSNDNGIYALNPIAIVNPGLVVGPPRPLKPGATWYATDVQNAVRFERPPFEQVQYGLGIVQQFISMAQDASGAPPVLQGTKGASTATGSQILQKNAGNALQDTVEDFEMDVMTRVLEMLWKNAQQYREEDVLATVGGKSLTITPDDLAADVEFRWMASSQAMNNQLRAQNAIMLINAITPLVPILMQTGYVVDFSVLLKRIYSDGFGFRGFDEFIKPAQAMPGQPPMGPQGLPPGAQMPRPDQMGGIQMEQADRARSALEQIGNMTDPAAGEAEEFMDVRAMADQMAADQGTMR